MAASRLSTLLWHKPNILRHVALLAGATLFFAGLSSPSFAQDGQQTYESAPEGAELAFVTKLFYAIQEKSFARNVELCGNIGYDEAGRLAISRINSGEEAACYLPQWPTKLDVIASFHTHSTYSVEYSSELPSSTDMESDESSGIDGWIATPGGRLWYVDSSEMVTFQVCGEGCLPQDPNYVPGPPGSIRDQYSYRAILKREMN